MEDMRVVQATAPTRPHMRLLGTVAYRRVPLGAGVRVRGYCRVSPRTRLEKRRLQILDEGTPNCAKRVRYRRAVLLMSRDRGRGSRRVELSRRYLYPVRFFGLEPPDLNCRLRILDDPMVAEAWKPM